MRLGLNQMARLLERNHLFHRRCSGDWHAQPGSSICKERRGVQKNPKSKKGDPSGGRLILPVIAILFRRLLLVAGLDARSQALNNALGLGGMWSRRLQFN